MAVQNNHLQPRLSDYQLHPERFSEYTGNNLPLKPKAGTRPKQGQHYTDYPNNYPPYYTNYPYYHNYQHPHYPTPHYNGAQNPQPFSQALDMLSRNDERQCVPRLLCEMLSNSNEAGQDFKLPFNLNLDGLAG